LQSIYGRSESIEATEKVIKGYLPTDGEEKTYRVAYAVHEISESTSGSVEGELQLADQVAKSTEFIGLVTLKSLDAGSLALPEDLTIPAAAASTTLTIELSYALLPKAWGKGYATESVEAVFQSCKRARSFWAPFSKLYVRAIVNQGNPPSMRVMDKTGMKLRGIFDWTGKIFLAGEWRVRDKLHIYGMHLLE
jgi:RimJ/RimL family protein N-acetyltransferase